MPKQIGGKKAAKTAARKQKKREDSRIRRVQEKLKQAERKKAVLRTQAWRLRVNLKNTSTPQYASTADLGMQGPKSTERRKLSRLKKTLPQTPLKKAWMIERISESPRTAQILEGRGVLLTPASRLNLKRSEGILGTIRQRLFQAKPRGGCASDRLKAYKSIRDAMKGAPYGSFTRKYFQIRCDMKIRKANWWEIKGRKKRKDRLSEAVKEQVQQFFLQPEISREMPGKSEVVIVKGEGGQKTAVTKHNMSMTLEQAYMKFTETYPDTKIGRTAFKKLKPHNVKIVTETSRRTCLCTTCCCLSLKLEAIRKFVAVIQAPAEGLKKVSKMTKTEMHDAILCPHEDETLPKLSCVNRSCTTCANKPAELLQPLNDYKDELLKWYVWEHVWVMKKGDKKRIMSCVEKNTTVSVFLEALLSDFRVYSSHIFRANWQHTQLSKCIASLHPNEIIMLMDYSENYRCVFQNEIQTGFFDQAQVTIHPAMTYYLEDDHLVKHALIGISEDTRHDAHLTKKFETGVLDILMKQPGLADLQSIIEWTDGCSAQYKCQVSVADITSSTIDLTRNYFETSHGKSPCDGLGSIVKNTCLHAITSGSTVLGNAQAVFQFCNEKLSHEGKQRIKADGKVEVSKWDFFYVDDDVDHDSADAFPLKGIRQFHSLKNVPGTNQIMSRLLSWYCTACFSGKREDCQNNSWVGEWQYHAPGEKSSGKSAANTSVKITAEAGTSTLGTQSSQADQEAHESTPAPVDGDFVAVRVLSSRKNIQKLPDKCLHGRST